MGFTDRYLRLRIVSAEPEKLLAQLLNANIELLDVSFIDLLTLEMKINAQNNRAVRCIAEKSGSSCRIIMREGFLWNIQNTWKRPILTIGLFLFILSALLINDRIFFVNVHGNQEISAEMILSEAEKCGIVFGTKASFVRSEDIKNRLLQQLPQLQWLGITTSGAVATIQVQERTEPPEAESVNSAVTSITASRDGVITHMTVYKGNPLIQVGQSVQKGDTLVSGYTDYGIAQKCEQAEAEVFAYTFRQLQFISPLPEVQRGAYTGTSTSYQLRVGKKVINLWNHSGISDTTCVKMYEEDYWTLPGDFQLPVSLIKVHLYRFYPEETVYNMQNFETWLPQFADSYVRQQMVAGRILEEEFDWSFQNAQCILDGSFACHEMIGQVTDEEIIEQNAEDY